MATAAERIASELGGDGQVWRTEDGRSLHDLCVDGGATVRGRDGMTCYDLPDGSVITAGEGGWDFGYSGCGCWCGVGHWDGCGSMADD